MNRKQNWIRDTNFTLVWGEIEKYAVLNKSKIVRLIHVPKDNPLQHQNVHMLQWSKTYHPSKYASCKEGTQYNINNVVVQNEMVPRNSLDHPMHFGER